MRFDICRCLIVLSTLTPVVVFAAPPEQMPWPAELSDFKMPAAGEHPRLLFRRDDLPALREKAQTAEGRAIIKRLRATLNGSDGKTMPTIYNGSGHAYQGNKPSDSEAANKDNGKSNSEKNVGTNQEMPLGAYSFSHSAGYGLLYQLTGDKIYADFGKQCFEKALDGVRNRDDRYSFRRPGGALRAGPTLGWYALGYDLCYDGWDDASRRKFADAIQNYNEGQWMSLAELARGKRQHPGSNHWGMQVGGAA